MKEAKKYINHHKVKISGNGISPRYAPVRRLKSLMKRDVSLPGRKIPGKRKSDLYIISERSDTDRLAAIREVGNLRASSFCYRRPN